MFLFMVIFKEAIASKAKEQAENTLLPNQVFELSDTTLLVKSPTSDPALLNQMFGLYKEADEPNIGAIFKLNGTYTGYHRADLWDWLKDTSG